MTVANIEQGQTSAIEDSYIYSLNCFYLIFIWKLLPINLKKNRIEWNLFHRENHSCLCGSPHSFKWILPPSSCELWEIGREEEGGRKDLFSSSIRQCIVTEKKYSSQIQSCGALIHFMVSPNYNCFFSVVYTNPTWLEQRRRIEQAFLI